MFTFKSLNDSEDAKNRVRIRATGPYDDVLVLFKTFDYTLWIHEHKTFVDGELIKDPVRWYQIFQGRIKENGALASFPELRGVVGALTRNIFQHKECYEWLEGHHHVILQQLLAKLVAIQINTRYMWPYQATILCIEMMLGVLDSYFRETNPGTFAEYYHNFRYQVYLIHILNESDQVCFPTINVLGTHHFIKLRCVPILLLGVAYRPLLADQYVNTPLDFWAHDIQHARRQIQETNRYYDLWIKHRTYYSHRSPFDVVTKLEFYKEMWELTRSLLILLDDEMIDLQMRNLIRMVIFEVVHEKAWPITRFALIRNIQLGYDIFPVENIVVAEGGLISTEDHLFNDPTTLANLLGKLRHGFFDQVNSPIKAIVSERVRTSSCIVKAVELLFDHLGFVGERRYSGEMLLALVQDTANTQEFLNSGHVISVPDDPVVVKGYPHEHRVMEYFL